jgi:hypothetical protein
MKVRVTVLTNGTRVKLRRPGIGERGEWVVIELLTAFPSQTYGIKHAWRGSTRYVPRDRLIVPRGTGKGRK